MTCRQLTERVMAYRAGELPWHARLSLQVHAAMCDCCKNLLSTYDTTVTLSAELAEKQVPDDVAEAFEAMVAAAMAGPVGPAAG
jgi:anti-sigma factor ChrR (cupin superfamily)